MDAEYFIIKNGLVVNLIVANQNFIDTMLPAEVIGILASGLDPCPNIGWGYSNGVFTPPAVEPDTEIA